MNRAEPGGTELGDGLGEDAQHRFAGIIPRQHLQNTVVAAIEALGTLPLTSLGFQRLSSLAYTLFECLTLGRELGFDLEAGQFLAA